MSTPIGFTCSVCGTWVQAGYPHTCGGSPWQTSSQPIPGVDLRIATALERIATALELAARREQKDGGE